jgi:hypothetical protein
MIASKRSRTAVGSASGRPYPRGQCRNWVEPGSPLPANAWSAYGALQPMGDGAREGPLTDPIADAQACRWELVKMPPKQPLRGLIW